MGQRSVELSPRAVRDLRRLPPATATELLADMETLARNPLPGPPRVKKLRGHELYRLRTGDYRSIFELREEKVVVLRVVGRGEFERILRRL